MRAILNKKNYLKIKNNSIKLRYIYIAIFVILVAMIFAIIQVSYSLGEGNHFTTAEYNSLKSNGSSISNSSDVKVDNVVPDDYSFTINYDPEESDYDNFGGINPTLSGWQDIVPKGNVKDSVGFYWDPDESEIVTNGHETELKDVNPRNGESEELSSIYENIGTYEGKQVDLRLSIVDYEIANNNDDDTHVPFIGFYDAKTTGKVGVYAGNVNWVEVKYEFCEGLMDENSDNVSNSTCSNPINVKGHITYNDIDLYQGVHVLNNNKGIYSRSNSGLNIALKDGTNYIYDKDNNDLDGLYNPVSSFTELFEGSSINRVFTFNSSTENSATDAFGSIWTTDIASGASLEYAKNTPSGIYGRAVKKNDRITYAVTYTNDDLENYNDITIKAVISKGLEYIDGSSTKVGDPKITKNSDGSSTLTWSSNLEKNSTQTFNFSVRVTSNDVGSVSNGVSIKSSNGSSYDKIAVLKNSVPYKSYDKTTKAGKDGANVSIGDKIKYNVKYANIYKNEKLFVITETLSKHLKYVPGSANLGEPVITKNSDGSTKLVWARTMDKDTEETLIYSARIAETAVDTYVVSSSTVINIPDEGNVKLSKLNNKVRVTEVVKEKAKTEPKNVPGSGSVAVLIRDSYTGRPVKNTEFALYDYNTGTQANDIDGNYTENLTSDSSGVVQWNNMPYGKYVLKEIVNSDVFKPGFYGVDQNDSKLVDSFEFEFNSSGDALKWYKAGEMTGGNKSGENFIERDNAKLGDLNDDGQIDNQDLLLAEAVYEGTIADATELDLKKYTVAADVDNNGKCNDGECKITKSDINLIKSYINNPKGNQFEAFKVVYLKDSYQRRATVSLLGIPLDLKISNLEYDTSKELTDAKFVIKDYDGNVMANVSFDKKEKQVYLPVGNYVILQEKAKNGYVIYETPINIEMTSEGDVNLLSEEYDFVKIEKSKDGNIDHLTVYNKLSNYDVVVPFMDDSDRVVPRIIKATGGATLVIGSAAAVMYRYGVSYKILASRLTNLVKL